MRLGSIYLAPFAVAALVVSLAAPHYLLLVWFSFYTSVSNFFIPWLPLRPMILLFGTLFAPWLIAILGGVATAWVEYFNYRMLGRVLTVDRIRAATEKRPYQFAERWFKKFPFWIIVFTGFTPVPYAPFRVFAVSSKYPIDRYIVAVLVGRTPRYFLWALLGAAIDLPLWGIAVVFVPFLAIPAFAAVRTWRSRVRARRVDVDAKAITTGEPGRGASAS
ncbi:MAG: VTT domain-containing protein [Chloroflexi bacterium]|nr:VTT domain-containing protein [Chloroflexota bacterium]